MSNLSWGQFDQNQLAKDISFESFCYQVAYIQYKDFGSFTSFFNTPGSEFYLKLHTDCPALGLKSGDEIGWQVKWWLDSEDNSSLTQTRQDRLVENLGTTLHAHANIKKWIICTPGAFVEAAFTKLKTSLKKLASLTEVAHWYKATFSNFLAADTENLGPVFKYYFNTTFIGFEFFREYSQRRIDDLSKKFDADLYTPTVYDEEIHLLTNYNALFNELKIQANYIEDDLKRRDFDPSFEFKDFPNFAKDYIGKANELLQLCITTAKQVIEIIRQELNLAQIKKLDDYLNAHLKNYRQLADFLNKKLNSKECFIDSEKGEHGNDSWRHQEYLINPINDLQSRLVNSSKDKISKGTAVLEIVDQIYQKDLHILSSAGYGKTNIACHVCKDFLDKKLPSLLILGSSFRKSELPQLQLLEQLGLSNRYNFQEFLQALNSLGLNRGCKIPVIIDGLNESKPYSDIWRGHIKDMIRDIRKLEYVILITTCRDRYLEAIFEESDITKITNTKTLVGFVDKNKDEAIKKYFTKYDISPHSWHFNKDLFKNPLLLKIFSQVNEGHKDLHISLLNIFNSIASYIDQLIDRASLVNSSTDTILKRRIKTGIEKFAQSLWDTNSREIGIEDFHQLIDPSHGSLAGSITEKLLDEGLCFQRNLNEDNESVQFTYDLVAGYAIVAMVLLKQVATLSELFVKLTAANVQAKLFDVTDEHPLRQDILMSLLHLVPQRFKVNFFQVFQNEIVLAESINSLDYFIGNEQSQQELLAEVNRMGKTDRTYRLTFEKLFENCYQKQVQGLGNFTIDMLNGCNQAEIDIYWSELLRKNIRIVVDLLTTINKLCLKEPTAVTNPAYEIYVCFLATTSSDKSVRALATENLFLIGKRHPSELLKLANVVTKINDLNAKESVIAAICGVCLSLKKKTFTEQCLDYFKNEFIPEFNSTHICIIDYIQTVTEFAKTHFSIDYTSTIKFSKKFFKATVSKRVKVSEDDRGYHLPSLFGLDLYDFNKHQLSAISSEGYHKRDTFTKLKCLELIKQCMLSKGFDEQTFEKVNEDLYEDSRYKYGRESEKPLKYAEKYLMQSYFELEGYLVLAKKLHSDELPRYRSGYTYFDPSFPRLPAKFQLINECFFPPKEGDVKKWVYDKQTSYIYKYFLHDLYSKSQWVLLSAVLGQKSTENYADFHLSVTSFFMPPGSVKKFSKTLIDGNYHNNGTSYYQTFAGEINWSDFVKPVETDYYEEHFNVFNALNEYTWTGYAERFENPYFKFLNAAIFTPEKFVFDNNTLNFFDRTGRQVTQIIWTDHCKLYYLDKTVLEEVLAEKGLVFLWFQFMSKSQGRAKNDFSRDQPYASKRLSLNYRDFSPK